MKNNVTTLTAMENIDELYALVRPPLVQELMTHEWFSKECFKYQASDDQPHLALAYFVPISRIMAIKQPE